MGLGVQSLAYVMFAVDVWQRGRWITATKIQQTKRPIVRFNTIRAIEYDSVRFLALEDRRTCFF